MVRERIRQKKMKLIADFAGQRQSGGLQNIKIPVEYGIIQPGFYLQSL